MRQTNSVTSLIRMKVAVLLLLLYEALPASAAKPKQITAALNQIPDDTVVVAIVPNCADLSRHLSQVNEAMGLGMVELGDILEEWKHRSGIVEGFNDNGSMVVMIDDPLAVSVGGSSVALLPVNDYGKFVGNFGLSADDSVAQLRMLDQRKPFVKSIQGYAVVSSNEQMVTAYQPPQAATTLQTRLDKAGLDCLARCDVAFVVNVQKIRPLLEPMLAHILGIPLKRDSEIADKIANTTQVGRAMMGHSVAALLRDTHTLVLGLDANASGVGLTVVAKFNAGSPLSKFFNGRGTLASKLLDRLPVGPYLMAMAINMTGISVKQLVHETMNQLPIDELGAVGHMIHEWQAMWQQVQGVAMTMVADAWQGEDKVQEPTFSFAVVMKTSDSRSYIESFKEYLNKLNEKKAKFPSAIKSTASAIYRTNEQVVGNVSLDRYQMAYQSPHSIELPEVLRALGLASTAGYVAQIDPHHVVQTNTTNAILVNKLVMSALALDPNEDKSPKHLGQTGNIISLRKAGLAQSNILEIFLNMSEIMNLTAPMIKTFMGDNPITELPAQMSTLAVWANAEHDGLAARTYVPTSLLWWLRNILETEQRDVAPRGLLGPAQGLF